MKKNYFNILFLSSALLLAVCGCDNPTQETGTSEQGQQQIQPNENLKVELNRKVYVQGEDLDVKEVSVYSPHYDSWSPQPMFNTKMPATCPNGVAHATVSVGQMKTSVEIMYFTSAEEAAKGMNIQLPTDTSKLYKESKYIKSGRLTFTAYEQDGILYATTGTGSSVDKYNVASKSPTYEANTLDVWDAEGASPAAYDATKLTIPHYEVTAIPEGETEEVTNTYPHTTYMPPENTYSANLMYEMITEADGSVCYLAPITHTETDPILPTATDKYWSKYKDYTQNPCFIYAEDYNAETNPTAFEKVLPEGGQWIVGTNNSPASRVGKIDNLLRAITGNKNINCDSSRANFQLYWGGKDSLDESHAGIEAQLQVAKVKCVNKELVSVFAKADPIQTYAYYKVASKGKAELDSYITEVLNYILYLGMSEVKSEPVLYDYYTEVCTAKLEEWAAKL